MFAGRIGLQGFSRGCFARRKAAPDLDGACRYALQFLGVEPSGRVLAACRTISDAMNEFAARRGVEPAYHNRHHVIDTLMASASLLRVSLTRGWMSPDNAMTCIVAMAGHDMFHDGAVNTPERNLELVAAEAVEKCLKKHMFSQDEISTIRQVILSTDPINQRELRTSKREWHESVLQSMCHICGDSDVFASCLPEIGEYLAKELNSEWNFIQSNNLFAPDSLEGRRIFLESISNFSDPAVELGLPLVVFEQLQRLYPIPEAVTQKGDSPTRG